MKELVVGSTGFIGDALCRLMYGVTVAGRRTGLDFEDVKAEAIPECDVAYICAGANGAKTCSGSQAAYAANVDGPIEVARIITSRGGFVVYISSMSVEWNEGAYTRQKQAAESVLRTMPNVGIVRAGRVVRSNVGDLCETLLRVGRQRVSGVTRWGSDDLSYQK